MPAGTPVTQVEPPGAVGQSQSPFNLTGTGAAGAITLTQPAVAGKTNYCTGIEITGGGATAASIIVATLASGGTTIDNFDIPVPAGATAGITPLVMEFNPPIAGLGPGQNMVLTVPSFGAGNTNSAANLHGFSE